MQFSFTSLSPSTFKFQEFAPQLEKNEKSTSSYEGEPYYNKNSQISPTKSELINLFNKDNIQGNTSISSDDELFLQKLQMQGNKRRYTKKSQEKIKRWTDEESKLYEKFICENRSIFEDSNSKRVTKIFIYMSKFIKTKNPSQCRSHHQKFFKKMNNEKNQDLKKKKNNNNKHSDVSTLENTPNRKENYSDESQDINFYESQIDHIVQSPIIEFNLVIEPNNNSKNEFNFEEIPAFNENDKYSNFDTIGQGQKEEIFEEVSKFHLCYNNFYPIENYNDHLDEMKNEDDISKYLLQNDIEPYIKNF